MKQTIILFFTLSLFLFSCNNDDDVSTSQEFTVMIENISASKSYFNSGTTGFLMPGESESFSFNAGKGHYLSLATMFVQSNDLFLAPDENGIPLYDQDGNVLTGDVSSMVSLWDAGTEVNEEPGNGPNQAPGQTGPDTGLDENGTVQLITDINDGFTYPASEEVIKVSLSHDGGTMFTATIENISGSSTLATPLAPGVWVLNTSDQSPLFSTNTASSVGLERLAEDGNNGILDEDLTASSGFVTPFAPGAYSIGTNDIFTRNEAATTSLEALAEDGDPTGFANPFNTPDGAASPAPIFPGDAYSFSFTAEEGDQLSFATMLIQSNDWFVGANNIELFNNGTAISGDITDMLSLYDAGTEVDEYAGAGNNQAPRQSAGDTGGDENGLVETETSPGTHVPAVTEMLRVTVVFN